MDEKIVLITGASDGIGKETAIALAKLNATIIMACRDSEKARKAQEEVRSYVTEKDKIILEYIDLASLASVKACASRLIERNLSIDVLINNAGVILSERTLTEDGFEMQFCTNYLGHFLLTEKILPILRKPARVINLTSHAQLFGKLEFDDINFEKRKYSAWGAYTQSKLANVVYANYLNRTHSEKLTANSVHPGVVRTQFASNSGLFHILDMMFYPIYYLTSKSAKKGAETTIYLASSPEVEGKGGIYWSNCSKSWFNSKYSHDEQIQEQLYIYSKKAVERFLY